MIRNVSESNKNKDIKNTENEEDDNIISLSEIADNSSISMQLGYGLNSTC